MGGSNASIRIEMHALETDRYDWTGAQTFVVQRRLGGDWMDLARFHEPGQARGWVDEAVARGEGCLEDYAILVEPRTFLGRHPRLTWIAVGIVAAAVLGFWIAYAMSGGASP